MNPHDMRELFNDALAESPPSTRTDTDDIVTAAKRSQRRRRTAQAGAGTLAAVAAVALIAAIPTVFERGDGTTAPPIAGSSGEAPVERPGGDCPEPVGGSTEEQLNTVAMYGEALEEYVASLGGEVANSCFEGEPEHHGFYYDAESGAYRFNESVDFPATGEWAQLLVSIHPPAEGPLDERMEEFTTCEELDLDCRWSETAEGTLLLVEDYAKVLLNEDDRTAIEFDPVNGALLGLADGTIVEVEMGVSGEFGSTLRTTAEQLGELAAAIPVGGDATGAQEPEDEGAEEPTPGGGEEPTPGAGEEPTPGGDQESMPEAGEEPTPGADGEPTPGDDEVPTRETDEDD
ncbi:hypothetical protein [Glycomyces arizonensis]|uniref:hypothetical protein n=1 Tax=Glycomyces arizonensis TaxID=256035 RepID=UPI00040D9C1E|nr:hypothetical protein [Glycomyces arizonensis]